MSNPIQSTNQNIQQKHELKYPNILNDVGIFSEFFQTFIGIYFLFFITSCFSNAICSFISAINSLGFFPKYS